MCPPLALGGPAPPRDSEGERNESWLAQAERASASGQGRTPSSSSAVTGLQTRRPPIGPGPGSAGQCRGRGAGGHRHPGGGRRGLRSGRGPDQTEPIELSSPWMLVVPEQGVDHHQRSPHPGRPRRPPAPSLKKVGFQVMPGTGGPNPGPAGGVLAGPALGARPRLSEAGRLPATGGPARLEHDLIDSLRPTCLAGHPSSPHGPVRSASARLNQAGPRRAARAGRRARARARAPAHAERAKRGRPRARPPSPRHAPRRSARATAAFGPGAGLRPARGGGAARPSGLAGRRQVKSLGPAASYSQ